MNAKNVFCLMAAGMFVGSTHAQINIATENTPTVITFQAGSPGVTGTGAYNGNNGISNSVNGTLASGVFAARVSTDATFNWNPLADTGTSTASYDFFRTAQPGVGNLRRGVHTASSGTSGIGNAAISGGIQLSVRTSNIAADYLYVAVRNTTGSSVSSWEIDYDAFRSNQTTGVATANFVYSTVSAANFVLDGTAPTFTAVSGLSFQTLGTGLGAGAWDAVSFSPQTLSATVANNDYLIFGWQIRQTGNNQESFAFDNISIAAIPEPSTLALLGIALGSALLFHRRMK